MDECRWRFSSYAVAVVEFPSVYVRSRDGPWGCCARVRISSEHTQFTQAAVASCRVRLHPQLLFIDYDLLTPSLCVGIHERAKKRFKWSEKEGKRKRGRTTIMRRVRAKVCWRSWMNEWSVGITTAVLKARAREEEKFSSLHHEKTLARCSSVRQISDDVIFNNAKIIQQFHAIVSAPANVVSLLIKNDKVPGWMVFSVSNIFSY